MTVRVKLFGPQARLVGSNEIALTVAEDATAAAVLAALADAAPALAESVQVSRLAVNHAFAAPDQPVAATDELALIGLVNGG